MDTQRGRQSGNGTAICIRHTRQSAIAGTSQDLPFSGESPVARWLVPCPPQGLISIAWLPVWLPNGRKGAGVRMSSCVPSRTRTYGLLLRRHFRGEALRRPMWPGVGSGCSANARMWPGVALCMWSLAPRLAPRNPVSRANVQTIERIHGALISFSAFGLDRPASPPTSTTLTYHRSSREESPCDPGATTSRCASSGSRPWATRSTFSIPTARGRATFSQIRSSLRK